jgi:hypothetical protein
MPFLTTWQPYISIKYQMALLPVVKASGRNGSITQSDKFPTDQLSDRELSWSYDDPTRGCEPDRYIRHPLRYSTHIIAVLGVIVS